MLQLFQKAGEALARRDFDGCGLYMDQAWAFSIDYIISETPQPSIFMGQERDGTPGIKEILRHPDWLATVHPEEFERVAETEGSYANIKLIRAIAYQEALQQKKMQAAYIKSVLAIRKGLSDAGLWFSEGKNSQVGMANFPESVA